MKTIMVTKVELSTRTAPDKDGKSERRTIAAGTHLTAELIKQHGYSKEDVEALKTRGFIGEAEAHVVSAGDGPGAAEHAAAISRAETAEAKVTEHEATIKALTEQLAAATKPATSGAAKA